MDPSSFRRWFAVERKTFEFVLEGLRVKFNEFSKGICRSLFLSTDEAAWFVSSCSSLISGSQEGSSFFRLRSGGRAFFLGKQRNPRGSFLRLTEVCQGRVHSILFPAGTNNEGWSQALLCSRSILDLASSSASALASSSKPPSSLVSPPVLPRSSPETQTVLSQNAAHTVSTRCPCCQVRLNISVDTSGADLTGAPLSTARVSASANRSLAHAPESSARESQAQHAPLRASDAPQSVTLPRDCIAPCDSTSALHFGSFRVGRPTGSFFRPIPPALGLPPAQLVPRPTGSASAPFWHDGPGLFRPIETYQTHLQPRLSGSASAPLLDTRVPPLGRKPDPPPTTVAVRRKPRRRRRKPCRRRKRISRSNRRLGREASTQKQVGVVSCVLSREKAASTKVSSGKILPEKVDSSPVPLPASEPCVAPLLPADTVFSCPETDAESSSESDDASAWEELVDRAYQDDLLIPRLQEDYARFLLEEDALIAEEEALRVAEKEKQEGGFFFDPDGQGLDSLFQEDSNAPEQVGVEDSSAGQGDFVPPTAEDFVCPPSALQGGIEFSKGSGSPSAASPGAPPLLFVDPVGDSQDIGPQENFLKATGIKLVNSKGSVLKLESSGKAIPKRQSRELKNLLFTVNYDRKDLRSK